METEHSTPHVWVIRPLTVAELVDLAEQYDELLAAMIYAAPTRSMSHNEIRTSLFHMFADWPGLSRKILATTNPPAAVLESVAPRTAAAVAVEIVAATYAAMPEGCFERIIADAVRDFSDPALGIRH